ncbi:MAG: galactose oxidase, partial [Deltaproteobacteria bacterium]|nr:galactose oxidase [Deltaproteobacteria bacterium]
MGLKSFLPYGLLLALLMSFPLRVLAQSGGWWVVRAPMTSSRTEVAVVEVGGKLYVVGGFGQGGDLVEEYDP